MFLGTDVYPEVHRKLRRLVLTCSQCEGAFCDGVGFVQWAPNPADRLMFCLECAESWRPPAPRLRLVADTATAGPVGRL